MEMDDNDDNGQMDDDQQQQDQEMRRKTRAGTRFPPNNRKLFQMLHKNEVGIGTRLPPRNHNKLQRMLRKAEQTKQKETRGIGFTQTDHVVKQCLSAFYESSFSSASYFSYGIDVYGVFNPWVGVEVGDASPLAKYLSQDNVQTALHVNVADVTTFSMCSDMVSYTKQYAACGVSDPEFPDISMINFYQEIAPKLNKTWIFSGDTDAMVPMEGTRDAVQAIGLPIIKNQSYRGWYYNETAASIDFLAEKGQQFGTNLVASQLGPAQFGGDVVNYEEGLSFITVHGAGHMVGRDRPQQSLHMFKKFIEKDEELSMLSPPLPLMENFDDPKKLLDSLESSSDWYETAQSPPYVQP